MCNFNKQLSAKNVCLKAIPLNRQTLWMRFSREGSRNLVSFYFGEGSDLLHQWGGGI